MIYNVKKGVYTMFQLFFSFFVANITSLSILWTFYIQNKVFTIIILLLLLIVVSSIFRYFRRKRRKQKRKEKVPPITDIIGTAPERLEELNNDLSPFGFAYEPSQDFFYSLMYCWQRKFGYFRLYDEGCAPFSMIIDCEPIYFNYGGMKWLIEFWKGQYGMTTGGEVGIYYTDGPNLNIPGVFNGTFYNCVEDKDRINMSISFIKNGEVIFTRTAYHWWITGFKLAEFSHPSELSMNIMLELYDSQMAEAFVEGLRKAGYSESEYAIKGQIVYVYFDKPHTRQPISKNALTEYIMQRNNRSFCDSFNYLTKSYTNTLDKLALVKQESPNMYRNIMSMGKPLQVYEEAYNKIKGFLRKQDIDKEG